VAGIHGRPYTSWDGSFGPGGVSYSTGYCAHDSVLFPTWHRPYLALFEQRIHYYATDIASKATGPDAAKWKAAALTLRIPYWDWAANPNIPASVSSQTISIKIPDKSQSTGSAWHTISNPLHDWKLPKLDPNYFPKNDPNDGYLAGYSFTVRQPQSSASNAASRNDLANNALNQLNLKGNIYSLLTSNVAFYQFASQANPGLSLEAIHGNVHVAVGGNNGHMTQLGYAAFDPIFWLHHANCDRMFTLWQALNPAKWISPEPASWTFTDNANNAKDTSDTGLTPFSRSTAGNHWTSNTARYTASFGYTYPEINDWSQTAAQLKTAVTKSINTLYGPGSKNTKRHAHAHARRQIDGINGEAATHQWFISIEIQKKAVPTGCTVYAFLGTPPTDETTWQVAGNLAGALTVFPPPALLPSTNTPMTMYTELALDKALQYAGYVQKDEATVAAYLKAQVSWRVLARDGSTVDPATIPSLIVNVFDRNVTVPDSVFALPTWGAKKVHLDITNGKRRGGAHPPPS
jgi:tyrosinase